QVCRRPWRDRFGDRGNLVAVSAGVVDEHRRREAVLGPTGAAAEPPFYGVCKCSHDIGRRCARRELTIDLQNPASTEAEIERGAPEPRSIADVKVEPGLVHRREIANLAVENRVDIA